MLNDIHLQNIQRRLLNMKQTAEQHLSHTSHYGLTESINNESFGELSNYDNHPADTGTELFEREKDLALNEHAEQELKDIIHALARMDDGSYGKCEVCGKEISKKRLEAMPTAVRCVDHAAQSVAKHRPIEEDVLGTPYYSNTGDFTDDVNSFDAEDAFQRVALYGTSETPADFAQSEMLDYNQMYIDSDENVSFVEDIENFISTDINGKNVTIIPTHLHEKYEAELDEEEADLYNNIFNYD